MSNSTLKPFFLLVILVLCQTSSIQAQTYAWAENAPYGQNSTWFNGQSVDRQGNFVMAGRFDDSAQIGNIKLNAPGTHSSYIAKFTPEGTPLWAQVIKGNSNNQVVAFGTALDSSGNVYHMGSFQDTLSFGTLTLYSYAPLSEYLVKYDSNGNFMWVRNLGAVAPNGGRATTTVATDSLGNPYALIRCSGTLTLDAYTFTSPPSSFLNLLLKFDRLGNLVTGRPLSTSDSIDFFSISVRNNDELLLAGELYAAAVKIDNTQFTNAAGYSAAFLLKIGTNRIIQWGKTFGGNHVYNLSSEVATDRTGNIYLVGRFQGTTLFGADTLSCPAGTYRPFLAKLDPQGAVVWAESIGDSTNSDEFDLLIAVDFAGNIYYGTTVEGTQHFGPFTDSVGRTTSQVAILKLNAQGNLLWLRTAGESSSNALISGLGVDAFGNTYLSGWYQQQFKFGTHTLSAGSSSISAFIAKIDAPLIVTHSPGRNSYCVGDTISVQILAQGAYNLGNQFVVQLSDSVGIFDSIHTLNIGKIATTSDTVSITCQIPTTVHYGRGYRLRIVSTNPVLEGLVIGPTFSIHPLPAANILVRKPATFCQGGQTDLTATGGKYYQWSSPQYPTYGDTSQSVELNDAGKYFVIVTDSNGCQAMDSITVKVLSLPAATLSASGPLSICKGSTVQLTATGGKTYLWSTGEKTSSISADTAGIYYVVVTNDSGCSATSDSLQITVLPIPSTPTIQQIGNTLVSSSDSNNQWDLNGNAIAGDTGKVLSIVDNGYYTVSVHNAFGCTSTSLAQHVTSGVSESNLSSSLNFRIRPNPLTSTTSIEYDLRNRSYVKIELIDVLGKQVANLANEAEEPGHHTQTLSLDDKLSEGTYFVRAMINGVVLTRRVVMIR